MIQKSGFIKPGNAAENIEYIATRDGAARWPGLDAHLSQQKEFKAIKNMVIREAENLWLGVLTFQDKGMPDEPRDNSRFSDPDTPNEDKHSVMELPERRWEADGSAATAFLKIPFCPQASGGQLSCLVPNG